MMVSFVVGLRKGRVSGCLGCDVAILVNKIRQPENDVDGLRFAVEQVFRLLLFTHQAIKAA
ncbi:hypothetical protein [Kingella oralis]|uniref:hypothetical protein n=1 Tax=Kingella oralis TaxID=505 RepID=UPI0034E3DEAD